MGIGRPAHFIGAPLLKFYGSSPRSDARENATRLIAAEVVGTAYNQPNIETRLPVLMKFILNIVDRITLIMGYAAAIAVILMMLHVTLDVVLDAVFNKPLPATLIIVSNYYMPLVTFLPLAFVERLDNHVKVDVATQFLPFTSQKHLFGWTFVLCFAICGLLAYATWLEAVSKFQIGSFSLERGVAVPTWPVRFAAPISYGLLTILFFFKFVAYTAGSDVFNSAKPSLGALGKFDGADE